MTLPACLHAGYDDESTQEMMRLYQTIHTDHEVRAWHRFVCRTCDGVNC